MLLIATICTTIILYRTDKKIGSQVDAMQRQLTLMEADQRPWIKVDYEPFGDLDLRKGRGRIPIKFFLTNVGKSPAFNVEIWPTAFVYGDGNTDLYGEQQKSCKNTREHRQTDKSGMINSNQGIFIFPAERLPWERFGGVMVPGLMPDDLRKYARTKNGKQTVDLWVYGCATYDFGRPNTVHQTGFVYRIAQLIKRSDIGNEISFSIDLADVISKENLLFYPGTSADGITN